MSDQRQDWRELLEGIESETTRSEKLPHLVTETSSNWRQWFNEQIESFWEPIQEAIKDFFKWVFGSQNDSEGLKWLFEMIGASFPPLVYVLSWLVLGLLLLLIGILTYRLLKRTYDARIQSPQAEPQSQAEWKSGIDALIQADDHSAAARSLWFYYLWSKRLPLSITPNEFLVRESNQTARLAKSLYPLMFAKQAQPKLFQEFKDRVMNEV